MTRHTSEDQLLIDSFLDDTYNVGRKVPSHAREGMEMGMVKFRPLLQRANRFVLEDDFTRVVTGLAEEADHKSIKNWALAASLPYDVTWIEFNTHPKMLTTLKYRRANESDHAGVLVDKPLRMGVLLVRDEKTPWRYSVTLVSTFKRPDHKEGGLVSPGPNTILFDPKGGSEWDHSAAGVPMSYLTPNDPTFTRSMCALVWGSKALAGLRDVPLGEVLETSLASVPSDLTDMIKLGIPHMLVPAMKELKKHKANHFDWMVAIIQDLAEEAGLMTWIVTLLAMLNDVPTVSNQVTPSGSRRLGLKQRPFFNHHRLTLKLPKSKPLAHFRKKLDHAQALKHRAHMVREHWRTYTEHPSCKPQHHSWVYNEDMSHRTCSNCPAVSTKIKSHQRGDASLGWVQKEYVLEAQ